MYFAWVGKEIKIVFNYLFQHRHSHHRGVEEKPLLVLGVEVEILDCLLTIEESQTDLITV